MTFTQKHRSFSTLLSFPSGTNRGEKKKVGWSCTGAKTSTPADRAGSASGGLGVGGEEEEKGDTNWFCQMINETNRSSKNPTLIKEILQPPPPWFTSPGKCLRFFQLVSQKTSPSLHYNWAVVGQGCPVSLYSHQTVRQLWTLHCCILMLTHMSTTLDSLWIEYTEEVKPRVEGDSSVFLKLRLGLSPSHLIMGSNEKKRNWKWREVDQEDPCGTMRCRRTQGLLRLITLVRLDSPTISAMWLKHEDIFQWTLAGPITIQPMQSFHLSTTRSRSSSPVTWP